MNLTISGHHLEVTPSLREYVHTKLDRVTRHFGQVVDVSVLLTVSEKHKDREHRNTVQVDLHMKGRDIHVELTNGDMYATIDLVMNALDRQVVRYKDRVQDHHHTAAKRIDASAS